MRILGLGGGQMGSEAAPDLRNKGYDVTVADIEEIELPGIKTIQADLSDDKLSRELMGDYDLIVCMLPARLGYNAVKNAISVGKNVVDLSYCTENLLELDAYAKEKGCLGTNDWGAAPGILNSLMGRGLFIGYNHVTGYVGGFAKDENAPLGYATSWSTEDLMDEYVRPARIVSNGEIETVEALSGVETFNMPNVGDLDAFRTDGLRTLLYYRREEMKTRKASFAEKTCRRAGHMDQMKELLNSGKLQEFVEENCIGLEDVLIMRVEAGNRRVDMVVESDEKMSAMAKSTALTCSAVTQAVAEGVIKGTGIKPPEVLAEDLDVYKYLFDRFRENGLIFSERYPFLSRD